MPPPPTRWTPLRIRSWASSGGVCDRQAITASQMAPTCSSIAARTSSGTSRIVFGKPGHQVAAAHFRLELVFDRRRGADRELDLLGRPLTDRDAVLAADVRLDRGVDVERPDPHRFERDHATERDHGDLGRAAADVDDHVAHRLVDRQPGTDRGGHRLLDEVRLRGPGATGGLEHRALLDVRDRGRHADQDPRAIQPVHARALEQQADHALRDLEVGDRAAAQWPDRDDVARACGRSSATPLVPSRARLACGC